MRILHVVTAWPRDPQDVITPWLVTLTEKQAERGHEVDVLAPAWRGKPGAEARGVSAGELYASLQKSNRLAELERGLTEEKAYQYLLGQSTVEEAAI